jgi:hypothetical protein
MANATTDSNSNPIGIPPNTNTTVSSISLKIPGAKPHKVLLIGEFSAECGSCSNDFVVGDITGDGNLLMNTQVNNLNGAIGTIVVVSGVVSAKPGTHKFDLRSFTRATGLAAHHRALSGIDLGV